MNSVIRAQLPDSSNWFLEIVKWVTTTAHRLRTEDIAFRKEFSSGCFSSNNGLNLEMQSNSCRLKGHVLYTINHPIIALKNILPFPKPNMHN